MGFDKGHKEFHRLDLSEGWQTLPGYPDGIHQKVIAGALDEERRRGNRTRLLRFAPGDPAAIIAGDDATAESIAAVRAKLGLDRPVVEQFAVWLWGLLHGDMGVSIFSNLPVTRLIAQRLEPTLALTLSTLFVAVGLAVPIGVLAAWKARRLVDRLVMGFGQRFASR